MVTTNRKAPCSLVLRLWHIQIKEKIRDGKFAKKLGVSRSMWYAIKNCDRDVGLPLLTGTVKNYPELIPDVINFLRNGYEY